MASTRSMAPRVPPLKPGTLIRRVPLFQREIRVHLSGVAIEILFDFASVLSEGQIDGGWYYGSTMITMDLGRTADRLSDVCDAASAQRLGALLITDERVRARARQIARGEADRLAGAPLGGPQIDLRARASGVHLHLDADVEAPVAARAEGA
jgi:hypothetical protein